MKLILSSIESWFHSHLLATPECNPFVTYRVEKKEKEHEQLNFQNPKSFPPSPPMNPTEGKTYNKSTSFARWTQKKECLVLSCLSPVPRTTLHNFRQVVKKLRFSFSVILFFPSPSTSSNWDAYMFIRHRLLVLQ